MGIVKAVCISGRRGTQKENIGTAMFVTDHGIEGDAHAGNWHRQVSLLSYEKAEAFRQQGADIDFGAFGENLIVEGFDFRTLPVGTRLHCSGVILEMTQIGKECHSHCEIYKKMGDCIMPREGVFAKVIKGGRISAGDEMTMELPDPDRPYTAAVITMSDKGSRKERVDKSGPVIVKYMEELGYEIVETMILADEKEVLKNQLIRLADQRQVNIILTTGGTGLAERDITPEATMQISTKNVPGIAEAIRMGSMQLTKKAMFGRGVSVVRNKTLIVNLPGSPKAVEESLSFFTAELAHGLGVLCRGVTECARR